MTQVSTQVSKGCILIVDDDPFVLDVTSMLLSDDGYTAVTCNDSTRAMEMIRPKGVDIVLSDIKMPHLTGIELLEKIHQRSPGLPVILMTAYAEIDAAIQAIKNGAADFILKPYKPEYLKAVVEKAFRYKRAMDFERDYKKRLEETVRLRTHELADAVEALKDSSLEIITRLTAVAEYRDNETGAHISRMGLYAGTLAEALGMPREFVETITFASPMHDIGKVGIPDNILLKKGPLTTEEFDVMKGHTAIGNSMLVGSTHDLILMSATVALSHHERWDGSGYPDGLKGDDIPVEGMIVMICDQYDALRSKRPYKPGFDHEKTFRIITEGDGRTMPGHFNPDVLDAFVAVADELNEIFEKHRD